MNTIEGRITVVQEDRFRLGTDEGRSLLLTLSHRANVAGDDLRDLARARRRVIVEYDGDPGLSSGVARSVRTR